jgi:hypothetical protein
MNPSRSTTKRTYILVICLIVACASLASADSLQLRNGRHLQGKYVGGSTTMIGFMTSGAVEYFQTADVLALMFDNNVEPSVNSLQPNHMNGDSPEMTFPGTAQKISAHPRRTRKPQSRPKLKEVAMLRSVAD